MYSRQEIVAFGTTDTAYTTCPWHFHSPQMTVKPPKLDIDAPHILTHCIMINALTHIMTTQTEGHDNKDHVDVLISHFHADLVQIQRKLREAVTFDPYCARQFSACLL